MGITVGWEAHALLNGKSFCIDRYIPRSTRELVWTPEGAICGDIDPPAWRTKKGRKLIGGSLFFSPSGAVFDHVIPLLGITNEGYDVYSLGQVDTLAEFPLVIDMKGAIHSFSNCRVALWAIRGGKGSRPIQMQLDFIGEDETEAGSFTPDPLAIEDIYAFTDLTAFDIDSISRTTADRFLIQVDNKVVDEHGWSVTLTDAKIGPRETVIATSVPYVTTHKDLYWNLRDDEDGVPTVITMESVDRIVSFSAPTGIGVAQTGPVLSKADQIRTPVTLICHREDDEGTRVSPLTITLSTPA